jgi:PKD repeat protein
MEHTFDIAGTYNVDLTVIDSTGRTASDSILITVEPPPPASTPGPTSPEPPIMEEPE